MNLVSFIRPDGREQQYRDLGNAHSNIAWLIGDLVDQECRELDAMKAQASTGNVPPGWTPAMITQLFQTGYMDIYKDVAALVGKTTRRITQYRDTAAFYPAEIREVYAGLPFSHFEFATRFGGRWEDVLQISKAQMDARGGKPVSVDWLEANYSAGINSIETVNQMSDLSNAPASISDAGGCLYEEMQAKKRGVDVDYQNGISPANALILARMDDATRAMRQLIDKIELPDPVRERLRQRIIDLGDEIEQIRYEIRKV